MTLTGPVLSPPAISRRLAVILLSSALAKLLYVFGLTDYTNYVFSDAGHYFGRARAFYEGQAPYHLDWDVFPMGSSVALMLYWKLLSAIGMGVHFLASALVLNIVVDTACVALVWRIASRLTDRPGLALLITCLYAFFYPLIYLDAFVISEHPAQLFFLTTLVAVIEAGRSRRPALCLLIAGLSWGMACQFRGSYMPCVLAIGLVLLCHPPPALGRWRSLALFCVAGLTVSLAASAALWLATDGASHSPTGNNGGFNFFQQQCHFSGVHTNQGSFIWYFYPALYNNYAELGTYYTTVPFPDQGYYFREGLRCLAEQPEAIKRLIAIGPTMLYSQIFPDLPSAQGYSALMPWMRHFTVVMLLLSPAGYLALRKTQPLVVRLLAWNGLVLWATCIAFNADHRHIYSMSFIVMLLGIGGLAALRRQSLRQRFAYVAAASVLAGSAAWLFTGKGPLALYHHRSVTIDAESIHLPLANGTPWYSLEVLRFWAPLEIKMGQLVHAPELRLSLDANDIYELSFWRGGERVGGVQLSLARGATRSNGMIGRKVPLPPNIAGGGFDRLRITPVSGDGHYGVAGLCLLDSGSLACDTGAP